MAAIIALISVGLGAALVFLPHGPAGGSAAEFKIEQGQSLGATARLLAEQDLVYNRVLFVAYAIFAGKERSFKAGTYKIPAGSSIYGLVRIFSSGKSEPGDIAVTIPEGSNVAGIDRIFAKASLIREGDLLKKALGLEGYLFPDSYRFHNFQSPASAFQTNPNGQNQNSETAIERIIQKMRSNFEVKTEDLFRGLNIQKIKEIIIVASMLEKEVKTEQDMRLVAGIIEKRLAKGMPLEIDATVTYGVCKPKFLAGQYCDVSLANIVDNLKIDFPYNTYRRTGLPPGPISNPGLVAIKAALNPEGSEYLYYLSAKDGTTVFSKTAAEHERARNEYLK